MTTNRYHPPSRAKLGMEAWINQGQAAGRWTHDYAKWREFRDVLHLKPGQLMQHFNIKSHSVMRDWIRQDDEEQRPLTNC